MTSLTYFSKSIPTNPVSLPEGKRMVFPAFEMEDGSAKGFYKTDNPALIAALRDHAANRRCGITEIDEAAYLDGVSKKALPPGPGAKSRFSTASKPTLRVGNHRPPTVRQEQSLAEVVQHAQQPVGQRGKQPRPSRAVASGVPPLAVVRGSWKPKTGTLT